MQQIDASATRAWRPTCLKAGGNVLGQVRLESDLSRSCRVPRLPGCCRVSVIERPLKRRWTRKTVSSGS